MNSSVWANYTKVGGAKKKLERTPRTIDRPTARSSRLFSIDVRVTIVSKRDYIRFHSYPLLLTNVSHSLTRSRRRKRDWKRDSKLGYLFTGFSNSLDKEGSFLCRFTEPPLLTNKLYLIWTLLYSARRLHSRNLRQEMGDKTGLKQVSPWNRLLFYF